MGSWSPGIGDPSLMGWFTVYSYYFTAGVCFFKLIVERQKKQQLIFWGIVCLTMVLLGVIKQFNLLTAVTEIGRVFARSGAWMEQRKVVQALAMVAVVGLFVFAAIIIRGWSIQTVAENRMTIIGCVYLLLFVIFRGISMHQFETILGYEILGTRINWLAELSGIYWVCFSVFLKMARRA